jgi:hypothetical protein
MFMALLPKPNRIDPVMAGRSRPKDGVASLAYIPTIHVFRPSQAKTWMPGTRPGMTMRNGH